MKIMPVALQFAPDGTSQQGVYTSLVKLLTFRNANHRWRPAHHQTLWRHADQNRLISNNPHGPISYGAVGDKYVPISLSKTVLHAKPHRVYQFETLGVG